MKPRALPHAPLAITATPAEAAALAERFAVTAVHDLIAEIDLVREGEAVLASGTLRARIEQPCAVTQDPLAYAIDETIALRFVPQADAAQFATEEEIDLSAEEWDEIGYDGDAFDLGEALAQTLGLAIDPYREGPGADAARAKVGIISEEDAVSAGPLAHALGALKLDG